MGQLNVRLDNASSDRIRAVARHAGLTVTEMVKRAINEYAAAHGLSQQQIDAYCEHQALARRAIGR